MDPLLHRKHWIFDLDGTLTVAAHDFDALRRELDLPRGVGILEAIEGQPEGEAGPLRERLAAWESEVADRARPEPDAVALVDHLVERGARLGVLTRNLARIARATLRTVGLHDRFASGDVLGRDDAPAKPDPSGIERLLARWGAPPDDAVMVGDFLFDLRAGRAAGVATILVDRRGRGSDWAGEADRVVGSLCELLDEQTP